MKFIEKWSDGVEKLSVSGEVVRFWMDFVEIDGRTY